MTKTFCCPICESEYANSPHHILTRDEGGSDDDKNIIYLCKHCHDIVEMIYSEEGTRYSPELKRRIQREYDLHSNPIEKLRHHHNEYMRNYCKTHPEYRERQRKYGREYYRTHPEFRERCKEHMKEYHKTHKAGSGDNPNPMLQPLQEVRKPLWVEKASRLPKQIKRGRGRPRKSSK